MILDSSVVLHTAFFVPQYYEAHIVLWHESACVQHQWRYVCDIRRWCHRAEGVAEPRLSRSRRSHWGHWKSIPPGLKTRHNDRNDIFISSRGRNAQIVASTNRIYVIGRHPSISNIATFHPLSLHGVISHQRLFLSRESRKARKHRQNSIGPRNLLHTEVVPILGAAAVAKGHAAAELMSRLKFAATAEKATAGSKAATSQLPKLLLVVDRIRMD
eukprot:s583_g22.t1